MNFTRRLARKLAMVVPVVAMAVLMIALVAIPAVALTQMPAQPGGGTVLNSPDPVTIPTMLNYQGYLTDSSGNPINGTLAMTFSIYTTASGGSAVWTETQSSVSVTDGLFNVLLGSVNPINASDLTGTSYLGVKVGADPEMTPRQRMVSVGYAFHAETLDGMDSTDFVAVAGDTMTGTLFVYPTDPITNPVGVYGTGASTGVYGEGGTYGVHGEHSTSGNYGYLGTSGYGVRGNSTSGTGVYGYGDYTGVYGEHSSGNYGTLGAGAEGVYGSGSTGVRGYSGTGTGVRGYGVTYNFYAAGPGTDYGAFTGGHEVKLAADFPEDIKPGLIVSVTGETQVRIAEGEITFSSTLPTVQLSDTPNDSKVFGVLTSESPLPEDHWYESGEGDRFGIVNALGEGRVWVTNINGDIEAGDYITTSAIAGYGQKQADDLLHSYTLGKAIESVDWSQVTETVDFNGRTYQAYAIAVVYTSG